MANITIKQIEDAMITAVENKCKKGVAVDGYVRTVDTYGGELDEALISLTARFPFVLFELDRIKTETMAGKGTGAMVKKWLCTWNVFVGAQNLRGEKKARRGTHGTYDMILDVTNALDGKTLLAGAAAIDVKGWDVIENLASHENMPAVSVYWLRLEVWWKHRTEL